MSQRRVRIRMLGPVRSWLRRKLWHIEYHSANRPRTAWTRAGDLALVAALLLALPATYAVDALIMRERLMTDVTVFIASDHPAADGPDELYAWVATPLHDRFLSTDGVPAGEAQVTISEFRHGWPVTTSVDQSPAHIVLRRYDRAAALTNSDIPADSPYLRAVMTALDNAEQHDVLAAFGVTDSHRIIWLAWIASMVMWWWILSIVLGSTVAILRFLSNIYIQKLSIKRRRRRRDNRCVECNYDLTGLEFNERCPECGSYIF